MGISTRIYQLNSDLAINIPTSVLPPSKIQLVEERIKIPGHPDISTWYSVIVRPYRDRTAVLLTSHLGVSEVEAMSRLGFDTTKPIEIRLHGSSRWIRAHLYHGRYVRVWIPKDITRRTKIREYSTYPVIIRGITLPTYEIHLVEKHVKEVIINHMGKTYSTENYAPNKWRWIIPKTIESYPVLLQSFRMLPPIFPLAELHRTGEIIYLDFMFYSDGARKVSEQVGYAWRNMAVRNYVAAKTAGLGYPFLCEIRVSYISSTPKRFYQIKERPVYDKGALTLKQALETSVYNLLQYFFPSSKAEYKYSGMSFAEHQGIIEFTTEKVDLQRRYTRLKKVPRIISIGEDSKEPWGITEYPYYKAIKYIRIIGKWAYKHQDFTRGIYLDEDIERVLYQVEQDRVMKGYPRRTWIDDNGFVWRTYDDEK